MSSNRRCHAVGRPAIIGGKRLMSDRAAAGGSIELGSTASQAITSFSGASASGSAQRKRDSTILPGSSHDPALTSRPTSIPARSAQVSARPLRFVRGRPDPMPLADRRCGRTSSGSRQRDLSRCRDSRQHDSDRKRALGKHGHVSNLRRHAPVGSRVDTSTAGFLARESPLHARLPGFPVASDGQQLVAHSCGGSHGFGATRTPHRVPLNPVRIGIRETVGCDAIAESPALQR